MTEQEDNVMNKLWKGMMTALLVCALVMSTLTVALAA